MPMSTTQSPFMPLLAQAHARAKENNLPYAGALTPQEAYGLLQADRSAVLIDVRTKVELAFVGRVPSAQHIEWASYPGMVANPNFVDELQSTLVNSQKDTVVIFMCRTGARSHNAATVAQQLGFTNAYNMLEGFEGEANQLQQRTLINGWRCAGLPWTNAS